jgi:type III restriction enzyme
MIQLKKYQEDTVSELLKQTRRLLGSSGQKICVFKSPTGSGKTIMVAELLSRLPAEELPNKYVFVWTSLYDLHSQSKVKLADYLRDTRYNLISLDEIGQDALAEDTILFVNWHSLTSTKLNNETNRREWSNIYVRDREDGRTVVDILDKTRNSGFEIVLIVDEAHRNYLTEQSQRFIAEIIKPKLILEVSATPLIKISAEDVANKKAGWVSVPFDEVIQSGLIKQETVINQAIGKYADIASSADEIVVEAAIAKRNEIKKMYNKAKSDINPLILVQLPSESERTSTLDKSVREEVEALLAKQNITYQNGRLAIWLADDKRNLALIEKNASEVEVLIFKEAVAIGWDCPRAQILVMLREIRSLTFEIQTVGRILRMPEARHYYETPELNKAFVYTNIASIHINDKPEDIDFFKTKFAHIKPGINNVKLPNAYLHRQDYGDLTASFSKLLVEALNIRFGIEQGDMVNAARKKVESDLELEPEELQRPLLADVVLHNIDAIREEIGNLDIDKIQAEVSIANIQKEFDYLLKAWCLPYAPVRSFSKLKIAIYKWFEYIGYDQSKWHEIQRIIACSSHNQTIFDEVIKTAKLKYEQIKLSELADRKKVTHSLFSLPEIDLFGDNYDLVVVNRYAYQQCYLRKDRSEPEKYFERLIDDSNNVEWWYKNGESKQEYLAISYQTEDEQTKIVDMAGFYPDYIVKFTDGRVGLYDTKSGRTITDPRTYEKSNALQAYIVEQNTNGLPIQGGILNNRKEGMLIYTSDDYDPDISKWTRFYFVK